MGAVQNDLGVDAAELFGRGLEQEQQVGLVPRVLAQVGLGVESQQAGQETLVVGQVMAQLSAHGVETLVQWGQTLG